MAKKFSRNDWASDPDLWKGHISGQDLGTDVTVLFFSSDEVGAGPGLHRHPYDEVFIVRRGRALFTLADDTIEAVAGDVLLAQAGVAHAFRNLGPDRLETTDIHLSADWIQEDLED
ncbi:cupin domain-containing protein [Maribius pontilimi]|uniref:Cupin domain-containing protein n=1 Tax=Palleronia pontilimi TaxID=1964209 RepID=A0A934MC69_9RHOB|nr:cupin domain-containing protein [Palleronia pontilimi]MBJ3762195.1 cupin domain-containing protein [Palleronia pontilimi]